MADEGAASLPELARSLRALGRPVDEATDAAHDVVFAPLLDARARASRADAVDAVAAFRGAALAARIEALARAAAVKGQPDAAEGRARTAAVRETLEPLRAGLLALDTLAPAAAEGGRASAGWALWVEQLKRVFSAADIACHGVARVLAQVADVPAPAARRWSPFRPGGSGR